MDMAFDDHTVGSDDQKASQRALAHLRCGPKALLASCRMLPRRQAKPCRKVAPLLKCFGSRGQNCDGRSNQRPNARHSHEPTGDFVLLGAPGNLGIELADLHLEMGIGVSMIVGHFADRRPILLLAIGALLAGLLCLALAPLPLAWSAALLSGLGIGALFPLGLIVAMDHGRDAAEAGRIVGFVQGGGYVLAALLPLIAGMLRQCLSDLTLAWWLMAALCLVLALMAVRLRPGTHLN